MPANLGFAFAKALFVGNIRQYQTANDQYQPSKPRVLLINYFL